MTTTKEKLNQTNPLYGPRPTSPARQKLLKERSQTRLQEQAEAREYRQRLASMRTHVRCNFYPPLPVEWAETALEAIDAVRAYAPGDAPDDIMVSAPFLVDGEANAWEVIDYLRIDDSVSYDEETGEYLLD